NLVSAALVTCSQLHSMRNKSLLFTACPLISNAVASYLLYAVSSISILSQSNAVASYLLSAVSSNSILGQSNAVKLPLSTALPIFLTQDTSYLL
ncbi:MAG: hypothetical protein ACXACT_18290, partial [Candidatus Thorarchaeota archaeon]